MSQSRRFRICVLQVLFVLATSACERPSTLSQVPAVPERTALRILSLGTEVQLTSQQGPQTNPELDSNWIVWEDARHGNYDIYAHDLRTGTETRITNHVEHQSWPDISGTRVAWLDGRHGNSEIYSYDLSTGTERRITADPGHQGPPRISGTRIVWQDSRYGNYDIFLYDLNTGIERRVTTHPSMQFFPEISEDRIVWDDLRNGNWDIYLYDLSTGEERQLTSDPADQAAPVIDGDLVAWSELRDGRYNLAVLDLSTNTERRILSAPHLGVEGLSISGSRIAGMFYATGGSDVYLYDLSTDTEQAIVTGPGSQLHPAISGDRIVWADARSGDWDIYTRGPTNRPPLADAGGTYSGTEGSAVLFNGSGSSDPDGNPLGYTWTFGDTNSGIGVSPFTRADNVISEGDRKTVAAIYAGGSCEWNPPAIPARP